MGITGNFLEVFLRQGFLLGHPTQLTEAKLARGIKCILAFIHIHIIKVKAIKWLSRAVAGKKNKEAGASNGGGKIGMEVMVVWGHLE